MKRNEKKGERLKDKTTRHYNNNIFRQLKMDGQENRKKSAISLTRI